MQFILFRHGIAANATGEMTDDERPLTDEGTKKTGEAARGLARFADRPDVIVSSPKLRAKQTAELAAEAFDRWIEHDDVIADRSAAEIVEALARRNRERLMAVGHEPTFSQVIELLCYGQITGTVKLKKAGAACLESEGRLQPGEAELQWLIPPKVLRKLGKT